ncbi:MAG: hypothetical protein JSR99_00440 [Proteobacteria bacterium]|nr:hypothetical protein [Pseudomonadota bacterium]
MSAKKTIVIVPALARKLHGSGKMLPSFFMPILTGIAAERGFNVRVVNQPWQFAFGPTIPNVAAIIAIYNEEFPSQIRTTRLLERRVDLSYREALFFPRTALGRTVGNKFAANALLGGVVPMPRVITRASSERVFSNAADTNSAAVQILSGNAALDSTRYNTDFVDTVHEHRGKRYYVCLRTMCVGTDMVGVFVRARPESDGIPSVHDKDTPLEPDLLNALYDKLVSPHRARLAAMCCAIGEVLGLGFFAHDILPERDTGKYYLCETGVKFHDWTIRDRLWPIRNDIVFGQDFCEEGCQRAVQSFFNQLEARRASCAPAFDMPEAHTAAA